MILLDTNVLSEFMLSVPDARVTRWLDRQPRSSIWTSSINLYEIRAGLLAMQPGRRRSGLESHFERILQVAIQDRILHFDAESAERAAELSAERRRLGRPVEIRDTMIAGMVLASHAKLATRNVKHFEEIASSVVNPWEKT
ncbi:MAG: type II toxin-antitoxin system VapC family toxin [Terracidiphilus sp.]